MPSGAGYSCAVVSLLIAYPILRLRGTFFAIAMLGVSHVCSEVTNNVDIFQGSLGLNFPQIAPAVMDPASFFYEVYRRRHDRAADRLADPPQPLRRGRISIREDEDTARMLGVPTERYKRTAFVISAVLTGMMGVIYAHSLGYITTGSVYRTDFSLNMIVYSLLGGMGTLIGPVIGAGLLVFVTQVVLARLLDFHLFATGLLLVLLILLAPGGG